MGIGRWGRATRLILLALMLVVGILGRTAVAPVGAQEATPVVASADVGCTPAEDYYTTAKNTMLNVAAPGIFANDTLNSSSRLFDTGPASHGVRTVGMDGSVQYTPNTDFVGEDMFTYMVACEIDGSTAYHSATVHVSVTDGSEPTATSTMMPTATSTAMPPCTITAVSDEYTAMKDMVLTVPDPGVFANDTSSTTVLLFDVIQPTHGMVSVGSMGGFTYTPNAGYSGIDFFPYKIYCMNDAGEQSYATGTVTITVSAMMPTVTATSTMMPTATSTSMPPCEIAAVDDMYTTSMDTALNVPDPGVFANDTSSATVLLFDVGSASHGMATLGSFGELNYTPNAGYVGTDSFQYVIYCMNAAQQQSYATGTVTITVEDGQRDCVAVDDYYKTTLDTPLIVGAPGVLVNDTLPETGSIYNVNQPLHGSATAHAGGNFEYTPNPGYLGGDSFTYTLECDSSHDDDDNNAVGVDAPGYVTATVHISVVRDSDLTCAAVDDTYQTQVGTTVTDPVPGILGNDSLPFGSIYNVNQPLHGVAHVKPDGTFDYTPNAGFVGQDSFTYTLRCDPSNDDGDGGDDGEDTSLYSSAIVTINVVEPAPTATSVPTTPVPSVTKTLVAGQPTAPSVSKLPVTGAGALSHEGMNVAAMIVAALMIVVTGALTALGIARRQR